MKTEDVQHYEIRFPLYFAGEIRPPPTVIPLTDAEATPLLRKGKIHGPVGEPAEVSAETAGAYRQKMQPTPLRPAAAAEGGAEATVALLRDELARKDAAEQESRRTIAETQEAMAAMNKAMAGMKAELAALKKSSVTSQSAPDGAGAEAGDTSVPADAATAAGGQSGKQGDKSAAAKEAKQK